MNDALDKPLPTPADTLDKLKRQAKQRFIGAAILLLLAVIAIPFVLGSQPRAVSSDITINIPKMEAESAKVAEPAPATPAPTALATPSSTASAPAVPLAFAPATPTAAATPATPAVVKKQDDGARAAALLSGSDTKANAAVKTKYIVQAGSYADDAKLQAASSKLTQAGLKHYTQEAAAKDGTPRTRLRLSGPFDTRDEANAASAKVGKLGLAVIVIKL